MDDIMQDIDFNQLLDIVEKYTLRSYTAFEHDGKDVPNVANLGAKIGDIAKLERSGEYYGIAVEFLADVKPLLTDKFIMRILTMLKREDYVTVLTVLELSTIDQLYYILDEWFKTATFNYKSSIKYSKRYPIFDKWIHTVAYDPLPNRIRIVEIGYNQNTSDSVVPADWIDREFESGQDLQNAMNQLENRIGKPPVTYAIIYAMIIQRTDSVVTDIANVKYNTIFYLDLINGNLKTTMTQDLKQGYSYVVYDKTIIGFIQDDIIIPKGKIEGEHKQSRIREVGLLVSRLQKAIRRGKFGSRALVETIEALNVSPNYNLPEHGFMRVSASKQLAWRLFVTILEDCRPYQPINEPSMLVLIILVLITQKMLEYKFTEDVLTNIKHIALLAQYNDNIDDWYPWYELEVPDERTMIYTDSDFKNSLVLATRNIIMRGGDNRMISAYYTMDTPLKPFIVPSELSQQNLYTTLFDGNYILHDEVVYDDIVLSSFDMHNKTYLILYYQACIPISMTTREISNYIWNISSSYNVRSGQKHPTIDLTLRTIQEYFRNEKETNNDYIEKEEKPDIQYNKVIVKSIYPNDSAKRTSFLLLFATKFRTQNHDVVIAGTSENPGRIKISNEWTYSNDPKILNAFPRKTIYLSTIDPPLGFKWTKKKVEIEIVDNKPMIDFKFVDYFDGSSILESVTPLVNEYISDKLYDLMLRIFSGLSIEFDEILDLRSSTSSELLNWIPLESDKNKINLELVRLCYTKIYNQFNNIIMVGPVSSSGGKMQNAINYTLEGKLWAVFNFLSMIYPDTIKPHGATNFHIKKSTSGYVHLIQSLETILFDKNLITGTIPTITTQLWDHQKESVSIILAGFANGRFGFGDSSDVGAGKTLTSLKIATELIRINNQTYSGILVLLPGNKLIDTWREEIAKHTQGFHVIFQEHTNDVGPISRNTIVVTTMGRNRDHPINNKWLLIIIDECLTVQNKNALWTEEAWKQSMMAKHLIMMSATFFRTRFDKLYYMLKILRTGLPERREYLDAILLESIVSQVSTNKRKWTSNINYFELDPETRKIYDEIDRQNLNDETKFSKLTSVLVTSAKTNLSIVRQLNNLIKQSADKGHRCLIYARSMSEAEFWSKNLSIPIYPDKGNHCIVTYNDGTYGLNDLVIYDTIVMRPYLPDVLPQIKGRLDRYGSKYENLYIEYFILKDTIEEGLIIRMNIASQFIQKYIMPLAKFYDISVNYKKYIEQESNKIV
ncbi:putative helicase [Cotonvirus japonicus]|uniref:Helicase n=1 Tax=Cotonvirus japonicus TaxID=2811091 RepID=A0ABM7NT81_9VIRU|nr:putative helicase [Cotonvirus japonicus]BCS83382.1 putative helicase [Cotonvirus japonicus]